MPDLYKYSLKDRIDSAKSIIKKAQEVFDPYAWVVTISGSDYSVSTLVMLIECDIKIRYCIYADTGTGFPATKKYVIDICKHFGIQMIAETLEEMRGRNVVQDFRTELIICEPKRKLEDIVKKNGFYGRGKAAHKVSFLDLIGKPIRNIVSKYIRKRKRNRNIIITDDFCITDSTFSKENTNPSNPFYQESYINSQEERKKRKDIWTSILHSWTAQDCIDYLEKKGVKRNPMMIKYGRSCNCNCGSAVMKRSKEFQQIHVEHPELHEKILELNEHCINNNLAVWGKKRSRAKNLENNGQINMFIQLEQSKIK